MKLKQELHLKLANSSLYDIAALMGYKKFKIVAAASRIKYILNDDYLGLYSGKYDFRYTDKEFLLKLLGVLEINRVTYQKSLDKIEALYIDKRDRFKSFVFIDTGFKRTTQPIIALAVCEGQRHMYLDYDVRVKPLYEQIEYVQSLVKQHYIDKHGNLGIWGDIQRYIFFYASGSKLSISPDGVILEELDKINISKASLTVGNSDITKVIKIDQ